MTNWLALHTDAFSYRWQRGKPSYAGRSRSTGASRSNAPATETICTFWRAWAPLEQVEAKIKGALQTGEVALHEREALLAVARQNCQ